MTDRALVSVSWLQQHLHDEDVRIVDGSWHMPASGRDGEAEFSDRHLPGAVFFDLDRHSRASELPHMLPDPAKFASAAGELGLSKQNRIVVYDSLGLFSAPRIWWMFRHFGAQNVHVLDGGLPAWQAADLPLETGSVSVSAVTFDDVPAAASGSRIPAVSSADEVLAATRATQVHVLDARSASRFSGEEAEVRPGLRSGHIPGSTSLPFTELLDGGFMKPDDALREVFASRGALDGQRIITTCGSGVTAAIISLALECIGVHDVSLYDGSWTEWGAREDLPLATG